VIEFAISRHGRVDAVLNNAGLVLFASLAETDAAVWDRMVAIGISAPFALARAAIPLT
jgi:NAD(P)-dependent dehydrogenase (short-subunit alcohol dehydrogenase family)